MAKDHRHEEALAWATNYFETWRHEIAVDGSRQAGKQQKALATIKALAGHSRVHPGSLRKYVGGSGMIQRKKRGPSPATLALRNCHIAYVAKEIKRMWKFRLRRNTANRPGGSRKVTVTATSIIMDALADIGEHMLTERGVIKILDGPPKKLSAFEREIIERATRK